MLELRPYQQEARSAIENEWAKGVKKTLLVLPTGCHAMGQKLLMADGTSKEVEQIRVGERLLGMDGTPRTVLHVTSGEDFLYKVIPVKGKPFLVTKDHKLTLVRTNEKKYPVYPCQTHGGDIIDVTVEEWLKWSKNMKHIHKLLRSNAIQEFPDAKKADLPIEPYFLGILLGDGGLKNQISVTTPDPEIVEELERQADKYDMHFRTEPAGKAATYFFVNNERRGRGGTLLRNQLVDLDEYGKGSAEKSVPLVYKTANIQTRLEVLAGLMDTDGSYRSKCNGYDFISKSKQLAEDVEFISRSCGLAAYMNKCVKSCGEFSGVYYRVSVTGNCDIIPCRVARKIASERKQKKNVLRTGFSIQRVNSGKFYGFTVDGDNRYLMDDFTITHNCGKTIVFSKIVEDRVREGDRVLVMAHRAELLDQAADKLQKSTGLACAVEKAEQSCLGSWNRVVVGSVQSLQRQKRLDKFDPDYFDTIVVDEAHHVLADSYQKVMDHFSNAKVLGVTATAERSDMQNLGSFFETLAYEYSLPRAIREGYLCKIMAQTVPLRIDLNSVGMQNGDYAAGETAEALDPYLEQIASEMENYCKDRKTVVFLPLIKTSQKFCEILNRHGFKAAEVNGNSADRTEILEDFENGEYNVLCNAMLLTEGWDCPSVDCVIVLRPTKIRSLYVQMVGRGTRLSPGKKDLLVLDFLWMSEKHELCRPADIICKDKEVAKKMTEKLSEDAGMAFDIEEAEEQASKDVVAEREAKLAEQLKAMRTRKRKLVDPLQFAMSIQAEDLSSYQPAFGWEMSPPSQKQIESLQKLGIFADEIESAGMAAKILDHLHSRISAGLTTPKQIRFLENRGFLHVGSWTFNDANKMISRISYNNWRIPAGINPETYVPDSLRGENNG